MRSLILGNGSLTVLIDKYSQLRDFYFPHVGQENHFDPQGHKIGVWVEGQLSWMDDGSWDISIEYKKDTLVSSIVARNQQLSVTLLMEDAVCYNKDILIKKITVRNNGETRDIRIFVSQHFCIYSTDSGNTVYYHPAKRAIIFYKGKRYFLISAFNGKKGFDDYATGVSHFMGLEGTYKDAEDGVLSKNPIEHGSVDATVSFHLKIEQNAHHVLYYYIACGKKFQEVMVLDDVVIKETPSVLINETEKYWREWVNKSPVKLSGLDEGIISLFKRSLLVIRAHVDDNGGIIASTDSDVLRTSRDSYNYIWPRDASFTAIALNNAGYHNLARNFFLFCKRVITEEGYMLPKYNPDFSAGSSWHPWIKHGIIRLPIQEDETALVLHAIGKYYESTKDKQFISELYKDLIKLTADFLSNFRNKSTNLPVESYDLWEEKFGVHTFTTCSVYSALKTASQLAELLNENKDAGKYKKAAEEIKKAFVRFLYDKKQGIFLKRIHKKEKEKGFVSYSEYDMSAAYALYEFDMPIERDVLNEFVLKTIEKLKCRTGGVARYDSDQYYRAEGNEPFPGNPWIICTLWLAQYLIKIANSRNELKESIKIIEWVAKHALNTGILSEQINPFTGEQVSVSPLVWSHAEFVNTVILLAERKNQLN